MRIARSIIVLGLFVLCVAIQPLHLEAKEGSRLVIYIDGKPLFTDKVPLKEGAKRYVPLRAVLERMGWTIMWSPESIFFSYSVDNVTHSTSMHHERDGVKIIDRTAYIEVKSLKSLTDATVDWQDKVGTISIVSGDPLGFLRDAITELEEGIAPADQNEEGDKEPLTEEEAERINFGKYEVPPTLLALLEANEELEAEGYDIWEGIGFYPALYNSGYFNSPVDVVSFGWTGGDGEHYGFLTDFGSAGDLEEAPIVMVSPMSFDQPAVVVANNLKEFLRIAMIDSSFFYMDYESEQDYQDSERERREESDSDLNNIYEETDEDRLNKQAILKKLEEKIKLPAIKDPYRYSANVRKEREKRILVHTQDKLGILNIDPADSDRQHKELLVDEDLRVEELRSYLNSETFNAKLAVFRDYNLHTLTYEQEIFDTLIGEMEAMGLQNEAARWKAANADS